MSTETLRKAAALMRERAEHLPGSWSVAAWDHSLVMATAWAKEEGDPSERPDFIAIHTTGPTVSGHVAGMDPIVALAVADWLDATADSIDEAESSDAMYHMRDDDCDCTSHLEVRAALAAAVAYLRDSGDTCSSGDAS